MAPPVNRIRLRPVGEECEMAETEGEVHRVRSFLIKYKYSILIIWIFLSVVVLVTGVILMNTSRIKIVTTTKIVDYTDCHNFSPDYRHLSCLDYLKQYVDTKECVCLLKLNLNLTGEVTLYYELSGFDQTSTDFVNSKDDDQLRGILTNPPSDKCKPYQYDKNISIAPCGTLADSFFNDTVESFVFSGAEKIEVKLLRYGMLSMEDKVGFENPANLKEALQNFSKPVHWKRPIYEFDLENEENNGFQNEQFISWMRTDWKRKPLARVNHNVTGFKDGLPVGKYEVYIKYGNLPFGYDKNRILTFEGKIEDVDYGPHSVGIILLSLGVLMLILGVVVPAVAKMYSDKKRINKENKENVVDANPLPLLSKENNVPPTQNDT